MNIHVGREIEKVLRDSGLKKAEFARRINTSPRNVYSIFKREEIKTDLLKIISEVLNYNFFSLYVNSVEYKEPSAFTITTNNSKSKVMITVELDGRAETLEQSIMQLKKINKAL
jgi:hypothetical protein